MRIKEVITESRREVVSEIERLSAYDYEGGKSELSGFNTPGNKSLHPLPGGSGFQYAIRNDRDGTRIFIIDPTVQPLEPERRSMEYPHEYEQRLRAWRRTAGKPTPQIVAKLSLDDVDLAIPNSVQVGSITVDEDYRGRGLAKALYGIVLTIMRKTLVAGSSQTPGGRRNWLSMAQIPGVEVKGFAQLDDDEVNYDPENPYVSEKDVDKTHDTLMRLGGQFIGKNKWSELWAFDVVPGRGELKPAVRTALSQIYDEYGAVQTGLFARWVG